MSRVYGIGSEALANERLELGTLPLALEALRRAIGRAPLAVLVPLTTLLALCTAPLGLLAPFAVWIVRDSWRYECEILDLYGPFGPEPVPDHPAPCADERA